VAEIATVHTITARQVRALANSTATSTDLDVLTASQRSKSAAMLALIPRLASESSHQEAAAAAAGWRLLSRVQRAAPSAADTLLRYPPVTAWAADTLRLLDSQTPDQALPGRLALVAAAAAIRGGVSCSIEIPLVTRASPSVQLPSLGSVLLAHNFRGTPIVLRHHGELTELSAASATLTLPPRLAGPGPTWRPLATVAAGTGRQRLHVVIDDADPYRLPGYQQSFVPLGPQETEAWRLRLAGGWDLLASMHAQAASDVSTMIASVVPLSQADGAIRSVTSRHVCGSIGMSAREDDLTMALTLAHEVQHAKLSALMDLVPLVAQRASGRYYAPWRPDPRPLASLLQGLYAHLAVARFWRRHRQVAATPAEAQRASVEFARWRKACLHVAAVIDIRPELTTCGQVFVDGMAGVLETWRPEYVPHEAEAMADELLLEHHSAYWGNGDGSTAAHGRPGSGPG
jgi:uncharacterized protein